MKLRRILSLILSLTLIASSAALFSACGEDPEFPVNVGNITLDAEPERIVILDKNLADIISAIGYDVKMVGRSEEVNQEGLKVVPSVGTAQDPSVDKIIKEKAEIVFADDSLNKTAVEKLKKAGIPVAQFESANTLKQLAYLYQKIGRLLGGNITGKRQAVKAYKEVKDTLKAVKTAAKRDNTVTTIVYLYTDNGVLKTIINGGWCATLLSFTGSMNVFENEKTDTVDIDKLLLANPNYIIVDTKSVKRYLKTSDVLSDLNALKSNTIIIPHDELELQGLSSLDVLEKILKNISDNTTSEEGTE